MGKPTAESIDCAGALPIEWQKRWFRCKDAYINSRRFKSVAAAERAAFEDIKICYLNDAGEVLRSRKCPAD